MISPHFPPDSTAASHRVRLLAPHLQRFGWSPTILAVDPRDYDTRLDPALAELVPEDLEVVRARAWPARLTRRIGVGDLGLRALRGLYRTAAQELAARRYDLLFIAVPPWYAALLAPLLGRRFRVPYVIDYIDPWVSEWGRTTGPNGRPDLKSRISRLIGLLLEPWAVGDAGAITGVSEGTYTDILRRIPSLRARPTAAIPYGWEAADFAPFSDAPRANRFFDPRDGNVHLSYVGTIPPLGYETLRALLGALALLRRERPEIYARIKVHFFGTTARSGVALDPIVMPLAGTVADAVTEVPERIGYVDALGVMLDSSALLLLGSSEAHYTASKLFPVLLARRPILALFHAASSVVEILARATRAPFSRVVTYDDVARAETRTGSIAAELTALVEHPAAGPAPDLDAVAEYSANALAGRLAGVFDQVCA
jgi:Glycosyl transferase 4-like domain